jgi:F-type H+-transporting ATPase subunit epsilon
MTVLPGHAPVMTSLKTGFVVVTDRQNHGTRVLVRGGFAEINADAVIVLAERAFDQGELTPESIAQEILTVEMQRDASHDPAFKDAADATIVQLQEARAALRY